MSDHQPEQGENPRQDAERDLAKHERPETGLIADEDLPEDLQPTEDNPLAKNPGESEDEGEDTGLGGPKAEGMPDMGNPGAPA